ncbi:MAG: peroxiredoxin, partial [Armatimonadota bacterium]|nr:peroxiredoxin [Armatimonadota bacterium]
IDPEGVLQYQTVHALNVGRSVDETLRVLQALQTGGLCPSDWRPGQETLKS